MPQAPVEPKAFNLLVSSISRAVLQMPALRVLMVGIGARGFRGFLNYAGTMGTTTSGLNVWIRVRNRLSCATEYKRWTAAR